MNLVKCSKEQLRELLDNGDINILEYLQNAEAEDFADYCKEEGYEQNLYSAYEYLQHIDCLTDENQVDWAM